METVNVDGIEIGYYGCKIVGSDRYSYRVVAVTPKTVSVVALETGRNLKQWPELGNYDHTFGERTQGNRTPIHPVWKSSLPDSWYSYLFLQTRRDGCRYSSLHGSVVLRRKEVQFSRSDGYFLLKDMR